MHVIGTAGHVDHGKSTLVEALTGIHPDRLKEEREREMTIDLGFAWMTLPTTGNSEVLEHAAEEVGIIDVPGHRDFIENMLAGIGGIDAALFVVAADEGVMPQTREHLSILDLLQIQDGVVALTKIDLIDDPDWLDLVEAEVQQVLAGTVLERSAIVRISARTLTGIPELKQALNDCLAKSPPRPDLNRPRLPIDRVFTISGFGTVVTGTLSDGQLRVGEEIEILPPGIRGRVRGLQTHKRKEQLAVPGSRTAINISGVPLELIRRGDVVIHPGDYQTTQRLDARFRLLPDVSQTLKHNTAVKLFIGAAEVQARLRLLGSEELIPGEEGWLQLELSQPVLAERGDRYILRRPSPGETLGGGTIVDPHPKRRHKRFSNETLERLAALSHGTPADVLSQALQALGAAPLEEVISKSHLEREAAAQAVRELSASGQMLILEEDLVIARSLWELVSSRSIAEVSAYHKANPLRRGISREELKSRLRGATQTSPRIFNAALRKLIEEGTLKESGPVISLPDHAIRFNAQQQDHIDLLLKRFAANPFSPPTLKECQAEIGEEVTSALFELGQLAFVPPDVVFRKEDYERMVADVRGLIQTNGSITVAQARDHFNTSRRYVLAFLEHLDASGVTVRDGDARRLRR
jgi:selenocysteine-specific elongation factor